MLEQAGVRIEDADPGPATDEAEEIYESLMHEVRFDIQGPCLVHQGKTHFESVYSVARAISGTPLRDSYHLGSTIVNDYGRPYESGFNSYSGASGYVGAGRFLFYARGEFQAAPSATGYSTALAQALAAIDGTTYTFTNTQNSTIPIPLSQQASHHSGGTHLHHHNRTGDRGIRLSPISGPRYILRKTGRLAGARSGRRHGILQQCGKHLLLPHRPH